MPPFFVNNSLLNNTSYISQFLDHLNFEKRYSNHTLLSYNNDLRKFDNYLNSIYEGIEFNEVS